MQILTRRTAFGLSVFALMFAAGCGLEKTSAPELSGPSEFAQSITLTASPAQLLQDGQSQSVITAIVRNEAGQPAPGVPVNFSVSASDATTVAQLSEQATVTDAAGRATTVLTAPEAPAVLPTDPLRLTVTATPSGDGLTLPVPRIVTVSLLPPAGTPGRNNNPVASFTIVPAVANVNQDVTFDASATTDEGSPCGTRCNYLWDFGDFNTSSGVVVSHKYTLPGSYTITLTVTDGSGGVSSSNRSLTVSGPVAPIAQFTVTPSSPVRNTAATFNATSSTVGTGATITQYAWDFGDGGAVVTTSTPAVTKTYTSAGTFIVTLTITDSLGRTSSRTSTVTVT
jgi:PKD repeat protein